MTILNDTKLDLAKRLRAARLLADLEQADVADRLGVARTTVSGWERGLSEPTASNFVRLAAVTGQPLEWFAEAVALDVRPEGFEPPTYCSVADALGTAGPCLNCDGMGEVYNHRTKVWDRCPHCNGGGWISIGARDELLLNRPCPVCGAPLVWGVCTGPHVEAVWPHRTNCECPSCAPWVWREGMELAA